MIKTTFQSVRTQVHITPTEAIDIFRDIWSVGKFNTVLLGFRPFSLRPIRDPEEIRELPEPRADELPCWELFVSRLSIDVNAENQLEFHDGNPDGISVMLCFCRNGELAESIFSGRVRSIENRDLLRSIKRSLKEKLKVGGGYVGPSGLFSEDKSHMYSGKSEELFRTGVRLVQLVGKAQFIPTGGSTDIGLSRL